MCGVVKGISGKQRWIGLIHLESVLVGWVGLCDDRWAYPRGEGGCTEAELPG